MPLAAIKFCLPGLLAAGPAWASPMETPEDRIVAAFKDKPGFLWGTATAAYQVEGAWNKDGRQMSMWDHFTHEKGKGHVYEDETGDRAVEFYERWKEDIEHLNEYGFNSFRMSIAWPRIFPKGPDGVHRANPLGVQYYKDVITRLIEKGIRPAVTMFHWDLPDDYDWLEESVVDAFAQYAEFLLATFPEVKHWITFNEPSTFCVMGYQLGLHAPGIKSDYKHLQCGHNVLKAHAKAVEIYRARYQAASESTIGITLNYEWGYPWNASSPADQAAAQLDHDFELGWWADPVFLTGDYPDSMRKHLGDNLPMFTEQEKASLKGSADFFGMNIYSGNYIKADGDFYTNTYIGMDGEPIGPQADSDWLYVVPNSMRQYLEYVNTRYQPKAIYVTENGCDVPGERGASLESALDDTFRMNYYRDYLDQAAQAVLAADIPLKGYYAWSLLDNFEWADGYHFRFGLTYVDYKTQRRYSKHSGKWFRRLMERLTPDMFFEQKDDNLIIA